MFQSEDGLSITRVQQNLLAASERRLLTWLCGRMPQWVTPDLLTTIGMIGAAIIFLGYAASSQHPVWLWAAVGGYVVQWFGDSMDGSLARFRKIERPSYGYFIDHSCDGMATLLIMAGMGLSPYVRFDIALIALVGYLLMAIHAFLLAKVTNRLRLSYVSFGPTELRLVLIALTLAMIILGPGPGLFGAISGFDILVGGAGVLLIGLFVFETLTTARRLARDEQR
ncbi:MAG: CDP-alcohol phosphatidyltransferase family protein [Sphingomicrobium sp.]